MFASQSENTFFNAHVVSKLEKSAETFETVRPARRVSDVDSELGLTLVWPSLQYNTIQYNIQYSFIAVADRPLRK